MQTEKAIYLPNGVEFRKDKKGNIINSNIVCAEALKEAIDLNILKQETTFETLHAYRKMTGFLYNGLTYNHGLMNGRWAKQCTMIDKIQNVSIKVVSQPVEEINKKLSKMLEEMLTMIKEDPYFNDHFAQPEIIKIYREKGPMKVIKHIKKHTKSHGHGLSTIIDPWREYVLRSKEKPKW